VFWVTELNGVRPTETQIDFNPARLRVLITDCENVFYDSFTEASIYQKIKAGESQSQSQTVFRGGERQQQVRSGLEEICDSLGLTDHGTKLLSQVAKDRLAADNRPVQAFLSRPRNGVSLELTTASLDFRLDLTQVNNQASFLHKQLISPLLGYAQSCWSFVEPPEALVTVRSISIPEEKCCKRRP